VLNKSIGWMRPQSMGVAVTLLIAALVPCTDAKADIILGVAGSFAVLGGSAVTNTGPNVITGDLGLSPGSSVTGFGPGVVIGGVIHISNGVAAQAQLDAVAAYNLLADLPVTVDLTGVDLGGLTLTPGVYFFSSSAQLTGMLTLDGLGQADPLFVFQIGSTLTTASASSVILLNGADACDVFFQVGSSATLGTNTAFIGTIIALASDTLNTGATVNGHVFALNGAVTLDSNTITACTVPAPSAGAALAGAGLLAFRRRCRTTN